jgi:hypothetical protein
MACGKQKTGDRASYAAFIALGIVEEEKSRDRRPERDKL